jgi:hypothetical protein
MALPRFARVTSIEPFGADTRRLDLELCDEGPLGFVGGQYIIVDTGLVAASGKAVKRAYSILSADQHQRRFTLATRRLSPGSERPGPPIEGLGSGYMHGLAVGSEVKFSGPWGKMRPAEGDAAASGAGWTLVLATDTGVTAALGLLSGQRFAPLLPHTRFLWLRTGPAYFLPDAFVLAGLPPTLASAEIAALPPIGHPERVAYVRARIEAPWTRQPPPVAAFIAGDGLINYALLDDLVAAGVSATRDNLESFFNMPRKTPQPPLDASNAGAIE